MTTLVVIFLCAFLGSALGSMLMSSTGRHPRRARIAAYVAVPALIVLVLVLTYYTLTSHPSYTSLPGGS